MREPTSELIHKAKVLLENTKKLRFFRGEVYDGGAEEYLRQLDGVLRELIALEAGPIG